MRLVHSTFSFVASYKCTPCICKLCSSTCHLGLTKLYLMFLQTVFMSLSCKLSSCKLHSYLFILQTIPSHLANYTHSSCKLYPVILQMVPIHFANCTHSSCKMCLCPTNCHFVNCVLYFQRWAIKYGLIARGAEVDLRSFSSIRTHFDNLSSKEVS